MEKSSNYWYVLLGNTEEEMKLVKALASCFIILIVICMSCQPLSYVGTRRKVTPLLIALLQIPTEVTAY